MRTLPGLRVCVYLCAMGAEEVPSACGKASVTPGYNIPLF